MWKQYATAYEALIETHIEFMIYINTHTHSLIVGLIFYFAILKYYNIHFIILYSLSGVNHFSVVKKIAFVKKRSWMIFVNLTIHSVCIYYLSLNKKEN